MKTIVLAALFGLGVALALPAPASAAAIGSGISDAAKASSLLEDVRCRSRRVCCRTARDSASLSVAAIREKAALDRGVKMRTLYQHSARRHAVTRTYVADVSGHGAEVRTLDEFFNRMIVIDRRLAIIPGAADLTVAMAIREPGLVAYLVDVFERAWERARPFTNIERSMMNDIAAEQRSMTIRMLIEGHSDPVSAKRLGVSARTFAGYVADLKGEYDADTRFQLGYTMGQAGVSGHEPD